MWVIKKERHRRNRYLIKIKYSSMQRAVDKLCDDDVKKENCFNLTNLQNMKGVSLPIIISHQ